MKSEKSDGKEADKPFPKLMTNESGLVVFFLAPSSGVVVYPNSRQDIGHYANNWLMSFFEDFDGSVTISND